jgi:hypothetical protein
MLLRRKGVSNPEEQQAYILQNQLTTGESARWISLANADEKISDAALNALELGAADARTGRLSCPPPTREAFFATRREHLRNFLNEQGPAAGDRNVGPASARVAVSTGHDTAEPLTPPAGGVPPSSAPPVDRAAVVARLQAQHTARGGDTARPHPGTMAHRTARSCFAMPPRSPSARPAGRASAAPRRSSRSKDPSRIGSASTTGRMHPKPTGPIGSMVRARRSCGATRASGIAIEGRARAPPRSTPHRPTCEGGRRRLRSAAA